MKLSLRVSGGIAGISIIGEVESSVVPISVSSDVTGKLSGLTHRSNPLSEPIRDAETYEIGWSTEGGPMNIAVDVPPMDCELDAILSFLKNHILSNKYSADSKK